MDAPLCKICGTRTSFFDRCDFHNNVKVHRGFYDLEIDPSGIMLDFHKCSLCGFIFSPFMDEWDGNQFATFVYNKDYPILDGSYNGYRAGALANVLYLGLRDQLPNLSFLDYGGGLGIQAVLMRAFGAKRSETYDRYAANAKRPEGLFNLVTSLEVLEHSINPKQTVEDLVSFVDADSGMIFFTTECIPEDIDTLRMGWWYVAPRVGHVSFYTRDALKRLFDPYGFKLVHVENHTHLAFRRFPLWATQFLPKHYIPADAL